MMGFGEAAEPTKLVVSELHTHISGGDLKEVFAPFGAVVGIEVQTANGQPDGPSIGVAVVTFEEAAHAKDAQAAINGLELAGKKIIVENGGNIALYGRQPFKSWGKLRQTAEAGSHTLYIIGQLDFQAGDQAIIGTSGPDALSVGGLRQSVTRTGAPARHPRPEARAEKIAAGRLSRARRR